MAETENISKMADKVSAEIFEVFGWKQVGPKNINFECIYKDEHKKKTHPTDVVFRYRHPYHNSFVYVNCDLKSYAKTSIHKASIGGAVSSLCKSVECTQVSESWQQLYLQKETADIVGLLFVYNHDGTYDTDFKYLLQQIDSSNYKISPNCKAYIIDPYDVCYLNAVAVDILKMRGSGKLPSQDQCSFFYPNLFGKAALADSAAPATIEMLIGPWQILKYKQNNSDGMIFYIKTHGEKIDEFLYVIDYVVHYQIINFMDKIHIKLPNASKIASATFQKAIIEYARQQSESEHEQESLINKLKSKFSYEDTTNVVPNFSEIVIGMEA